VVKPFQRREMAKDTVEHEHVNVSLVCRVFQVSETCYRYQAKLCDENVKIAHWLIRLAQEQRNGGFGQCFLFLRNVKGFK
jgi:putative transposase